MPIYLQKSEATVQWGIWKMDESIEALLALLPDSATYEQGMQRFAVTHRRLEWLSVRVLLYHLLGESKEIGYEPCGKPYLTDHSYLISISHTKGYVAVILSAQGEVGIDIEQYGQRIHKVAHKFMREDEKAPHYNGDDTWGLLLHWSAKEVMFKCMNSADVDFREHLCIFPFVAQQQGHFEAHECRTEHQRTFSIHYQLHPDFVLTWQMDESYKK